MRELTLWSTFFVVVATSAATLVGLMFVVITLIQGAISPGDRRTGFAAFTTPTLMLFCAALLLSLILIAPWHDPLGPAALTIVVGVCGIAYVVRVTRLAHRLEAYEPDAEDHVWYSLLPLLAYAAQCAGGVLLLRDAPVALGVVAAGAGAAILIGVRNAWDVVTYLAMPRE